MRLREIHGHLLVRIRELREQDDGSPRPVYLIQHGLSAGDLDNVQRDTREQLRVTDLSVAAWSHCYLPVLAIASEVGYEFGSTGHEYWPVLEERLDVQFTEERRQALRDLFRLVVNLTRVEPPDTPWAASFNLICWPIAHAVLPRRLHEPLLRAILALTKPIIKGGPYFDHLKEQCPRDTPLGSFFADEPLARAIVEGMIADVPTALLTPEFVERLRKDVIEAPMTRALAGQVRQRQLALGPAPARTKPAGRTSGARDPGRALPITLFIGDVSVEPRIPALRQAVLLFPEVERLRTRIFGLHPYCTLGALATDGAALPTLRQDAAGAGEGRPVIDEKDLPAHKHAAAHLKLLQVSLRRPLVFIESSTGDTATQASGTDFPRGSTLWVVPTSAAGAPPAMSGRRSVRGEPIYRVDPATVTGWLAQQGLREWRSPRVRLYGAPSMNQPLSAGRGVVAGDLLALSVSGGPLSTRVGRDALELVDGLYVWRTSDDAPLKLDIEESAVTRAQTVVVDVVDRRSQRAPMVEIVLEGTPTVGALRAGRLALRVSSSAPIVGVRLSIRATELGGQDNVWLYSAPMAALPAVVASTDPIWEHLATTMSGSRSVVLDVEAGCLGAYRCTLDAEDRSTAWTEDDDLRSPVDSEEASRFDSRRPWESGVGSGNSRLWLVQPLRARSSSADPEPILGAGTVVRASGPLVIGAASQVERPKRLLRTLESDGRNVGAGQIATAWLCWATGVPSDILAGAGGREIAAALDAWTSAGLCGQSWESEEAATKRGMELTFGAHVAARLWDTSACRDGAADEALDAAGLEQVRSALGRALSPVEGWLRAGALDADSWDALADAVGLIANGAYRSAFAAMKLPELEVDVACPTDDLAHALPAAIASFDAAHRGEALAGMLLPHSLQRTVAALDYHRLADAQIVEELADVLKSRHEGEPWSVGQVTVLFDLWVRPGRVRFAVLTDVLERALNDRGAARVVRYAALRRRAALGMAI